jgi:hypothetical protein
MKNRILFLFAIVLTVVLSLPRPAAASDLTTVGITQCVADDTDTTCANQMVLKFAVSYGISQTLALAYIDSVTTVGGDQTQTLEEALTFQATKTEPEFIYPLRSIDLVGSPHPTAPFQSYEIDPPTQSFTVTLQVWKGTALMITDYVSPNSPLFLDKTSAHPIKITLLDGTPPAPPRDFSSDLLFTWSGKSLLVPRALLPANTSLNYATAIATLLQRLLTQDQALMASNLQTEYLLDGMKIFQGAPALDQTLGLVVLNPSVSYSTISLLVDSADVNNMTNEAQGYITGGSVAPFASMSKNGTLNVSIQNSGSSQTDYLVTVTNCSPNINPVAPQAQTLIPTQSANLAFDISTNANTTASHNCLVTLSAPTGLVFDSVTVYFDTTAGSY